MLAETPRRKDGPLMLRRILAYADKMFQLTAAWKQVGDARTQPVIPISAITAAIFILFLNRFPSLNHLDQYRRQGAWRYYLGRRIPSGDEIAWASESIDPDSLRDILAHSYTRLMRNKVLQPWFGWRVAAIDGHEINASYKRCCDHCLQRELEVQGEKRIQYYHRIVVLQLIGPRSRLLLDAEMQRPGEDEIGAALRLIERVLRRFPRAFDLLTGDGLYARAPVLKLLAIHDKYALMVLKDERRDLLVDARALFARQSPATHIEQTTRYDQWDLEGFTSWDTVPFPVRVIRSLETTTARQHVNGQMIEVTTVRDWIWVSTLPRSLLPTSNAVIFGHARWQIENYAFNELSTAWHADHYFHHHSVSIIAFWLLMFIAHTVFHTFCDRNLKPAFRNRYSMLFIAEQLRTAFVFGDWDRTIPTQ